MNLLLGSLFFALTQQAAVGPFDPSVDWKTLSTKHFKIHYEPELEDTARRVEALAEKVYKGITEDFRWEPGPITHIVLVDQMDDPNGLSTPIPYNTIYLYANPPTEDSSLDHYDDWIHMLLVHEFTHIVHIDMVGGFNKFPRAILGRAWVPNAVEPQWILEGLAVYEETKRTSRGRGRSSFVDMALRTSSLEDRFTPIDRATYWNDAYPYGNAAYWYGIGFHQFLAEKYGEEKIFDFARLNARTWYPSFLNFKTEKIFGRSFASLWDEWKEKKVKESRSLVQADPTQFKAKKIEETHRLSGAPAWNDDGSILYIGNVDKDERKSLLALHFNGSGKHQVEIIKKGLAPSMIFYFDQKLFYSKSSGAIPFRIYGDLWMYDLKTKEESRLTRGLRLRDPLVTSKGIYAVRTHRFKTSLVFLPLNIKEEKSLKVAENIKQLDLIYKADGWNTISKPALSPDGQKIVFSMRVENGFRDLYEFDLKNQKLR